MAASSGSLLSCLPPDYYIFSLVSLMSFSGLEIGVFRSLLIIHTIQIQLLELENGFPHLLINAVIVLSYLVISTLASLTYI